MTKNSDIAQLAELMEDYAQHIKEQLPAEQRAIIDALVMAEDVRRNNYPPKLIVARLRGASMQHKPKSIAIASFMELLANKIDERRLS